MSPGVRPATLRTMSRRARPMAALARNPGPRHPASAWMPTCEATGPLTIMTCMAPPVVAAVPARLKPSRMAALTPATTTGKCSGLQPAITALMASFSSVARELRGCITPSECWGSASMAASMSRTASSVGGTTGSPSVQPCSQK